MMPTRRTPNGLPPTDSGACRQNTLDLKLNTLRIMLPTTWRMLERCLQNWTHLTLVFDVPGNTLYVRNKVIFRGAF